MGSHAFYISHQQFVPCIELQCRRTCPWAPGLSKQTEQQQLKSTTVIFMRCSQSWWKLATYGIRRNLTAWFEENGTKSLWNVLIRLIHDTEQLLKPNIIGFTYGANTGSWHFKRSTCSWANMKDSLLWYSVITLSVLMDTTNLRAMVGRRTMYAFSLVGAIFFRKRDHLVDSIILLVFQMPLKKFAEGSWNIFVQQ